MLEDDKPREACGIFGIYAPGLDVARLTYFGLYSLQHRGQESAGIAVSDGRRINCHRGMGLVGEVFTEDLLGRMHGPLAIGHVRYSTTGESTVENAQPLVFHYQQGMLALGHNGNLTNYAVLRKKLAEAGAVFQSTTDSELIVSILARTCNHSLAEGILKTMGEIEGAYSLVVMTESQLYGIRDPYGVRPLCLGRLDQGYVLASESCALDTVGAQFVRDLEPGEVVLIDGNGVTSLRALNLTRRALCIFEFVYFARPDSVIDGLGVNQARHALGRELAREYRIEADLVVPVPDSATSSALAYAAATQIPFCEGLIKNRYVGRTFIRPTQEMRDLGVRLKLNPVREVLDGKRVIMIDDSIVRGTTSSKIVQMIREAGAREVHMLVSSPPILYPCYYGIDTSRRGELIAAQHGLSEIREFIGADSLNYLSLEGLFAAMAPLASRDFCVACFNGCYPMAPPAE
ncbi:MAG: amidophosphoribosyltransferase [Bacillota bacterium]|nr:amidophosphoribosyltransferase [Bacillota bacterium]